MIVDYIMNGLGGWAAGCRTSAGLLEQHLLKQATSSQEASCSERLGSGIAWAIQPEPTHKQGLWSLSPSCSCDLTQVSTALSVAEELGCDLAGTLR